MTNIEQVKKAIKLLEALTNKKVRLKEQSDRHLFGHRRTKEQNVKIIGEEFEYFFLQPFFHTKTRVPFVISIWEPNESYLRIGVNYGTEFEKMLLDLAQEDYPKKDKNEVVKKFKKEIMEEIPEKFDDFLDAIKKKLNFAKEKGTVISYKCNKIGQYSAMFHVKVNGL